jgi:hypothetical protein
MKVTELTIILDAEPTDLLKLDEYGFNVHTPYGKTVARKNFPLYRFNDSTGLDIFAYHNHGFLKLVVAEQNPEDAVRRYDELAEFSLVEMFNVTKIATLVRQLGFPIECVSIKTKHNHSERLLTQEKTYWETYIFRSFIKNDREDVSFHRIDVGLHEHWEINDEKPGDFNRYLQRLSDMGFPLSEAI